MGTQFAIPTFLALTLALCPEMSSTIQDEASEQEVPARTDVITGEVKALRRALDELERQFEHEDAEVYHRLRVFLEAAGGSVDCVEPAAFMGIRGLSASCDIKEGQVLMFTPARTMLSMNTADEDVRDRIKPDEDTWFLAKMGKHPAASMVMLALLLLREFSLGSRSFFASYIAALPADPPEIAALGDEVQIAAMSALLPDARSRRDEILKSVSDHVSRSPGMFGNASDEEQKRAISYVLSRAHAFKSLGLTEHVLIPFQDLPNHNEIPNCYQICKANGCKYVALRDIARGEQICHSYGSKSNLNLLYTYGFASENNYSALRITLDDASDNAVEACGNTLKLDRNSPFALEPDGVRCLREFEEHPKFLQSVSNACSNLRRHLIEEMQVYNSLESLSARSPPHVLDVPIDTAIREELAALQRCASESGEVLQSMAPEMNVNQAVRVPKEQRVPDDVQWAAVRNVLDERTIEVRDLQEAHSKIQRLQLANVGSLSRGLMTDDEYGKKKGASKKALEKLTVNQMIKWKEVANSPQVSDAEVVFADVWTWSGQYINGQLGTPGLPSHMESQEEIAGYNLYVNKELNKEL